MNSELKKLLADSAWYEGRKKDVAYIYNDLKRNELSIPNDIIYKLIEEFEYVHLHYETKNGIFIEVYFSVDKGIENTSIELHSAFERIFGEPLVPIGCLGESIGVIEMSYSGKLMLIVPEEGMFFLGDNLTAALECIFFQNTLNKIADIPAW